MTATRSRRLVPLLIATLLAGGGASLSSTAFAAPTTTTASVTTDTDTDTDSRRTVKTITKTPRTIKTIKKTPKFGDAELSGGVGGSKAPPVVLDCSNVPVFCGGTGGKGGSGE
ncbi:hypothetical protein [Streptomyces sp. NPDC054787]